MKHFSRILLILLGVYLFLPLTMRADSTDVTLNYTVNSGYTFNVPSVVSIGSSKTATLDVTVSNVLLNVGESVNVSVDSNNYNNGWKLVYGSDSLPYSLTYNSEAIVPNETFYTVSSGNPSSVNVATMNVTVTGNTPYSGTFSDILNFTTSIETVSQSKAYLDWHAFMDSLTDYGAFGHLKGYIIDVETNSSNPILDQPMESQFQVKTEPYNEYAVNIVTSDVSSDVVKLTVVTKADSISIKDSDPSYIPYDYLSYKKEDMMIYPATEAHNVWWYDISNMTKFDLSNLTTLSFLMSPEDYPDLYEEHTYNSDFSWANNLLSLCPNVELRSENFKCVFPWVDDNTILPNWSGGHWVKEEVWGISWASFVVD